MSYLFGEKTWPQLQKAIEDNTILLLPLGQVEEHGLHLPTGSDTIIAERVCCAVAERVIPGIPVLVLPSIAYGYVPVATQKGWPGSFRVRWRVMVEYLADVCGSAVEMGFRKVVIVSSHGPHGDIARLAAREVFDQTGVAIIVTQPHTLMVPTFKKVRKSQLGGAWHACEYETSLMMHLGYTVDLTGVDDRDRVRFGNEWVGGDYTAPSKVTWSTWALQESQTGAYGDPTVATAETGKACMDAIVNEYCRFLQHLHEYKPAHTESGMTHGSR